MMNSPLVDTWQAKRRGRRRRTTLWVALALMSPGCVLDTDARCGPNQVSWEGNERCVCAEGTAYTPTGCVPIPAGIGTPCVDTSECSNPAFPHCQISPAGDGYCTTVGCTGPADCSGGYACNTLAAPAYCQRPPSGAGMTCAADSDCAGKEASFCDVVVSRTCLVRDCTVEPNSCFSGSECCVIQGPVPLALCIPEGFCLPS